MPLPPLENNHCACLASVIIVNWNGKHFLRECLDSLQKQTMTDFETILVDNGSVDGSVEFVKDTYSDCVRIIENDRNLGFAEGNNKGIATARGKYIILINNDTVLKEGFLEELIAPAEQDPSVGMCASKIVFYDNPSIIDAVGFLLYKDGLNRQKGHLEKDEGQYDFDTEILIPPGCGSLYRKSMLDEIGLFDEDFFAYGEDTDLGLRGRLAGWKCIYAHRAVILHKGSGTTGRYSEFKAFHVERNRVWVALKNFPFALLVINPVFTCYRFIFQALAALTNRGAAGNFRKQFSSFSLLKILIRAYCEAFKKIPSMMRKRKAITRSRRVGDREIIKWLSTYGISARRIAFMD